MGQGRDHATEGVADLSLVAGLVRAAAGVSAVVGAVAVLDAVGGGPHRWALAAGSLTVSAVVGAMAVRHKLRPFRASSAGHVAGVAGVLVALNSLNHIALTGDPLTSTYLMLTLVAAGAVFTMVRWLLVVDAVALAGFALLAAGRSADPAWRHFALMLLICVATAHVLQHLRAQGQAELQRLTEALAVQARRDHLTGLHNRHGLADLVPGLLGPGSTVGVLCLDVDGFKRINDELGHAAGDTVLVEIADRLRATAPDGACPVRLGGGEFAGLGPGATPGLVAGPGVGKRAWWGRG